MGVGKYIERGRSNNKKAEMNERYGREWAGMPSTLEEIFPPVPVKDGILQPHPADCSIYDAPTNRGVVTMRGNVKANAFDQEEITVSQDRVATSG